MAIKHYSKVTDFNKEDFIDLFKRADYFIEHKDKAFDFCKGKVIATLFFQPSTRTSGTFQAGMIKLGGGWIGVSGAQGTSMEKGESFEDTVENYSRFSDIIVIRHPDDDAAERAVQHSLVPIINGGSGSKEHPGGFCMLYGAYRRFKKLEGLKFGIYGTPGINRASKSLVQILGMFNSEIYLDDLGGFPLPPDVEQKAKDLGAKKIVYDRLENFIGKIDCLMVTRALQTGIIKDFPKEKADEILRRYKPITMKEVNMMRKDAILTMALPRIFEIDKEVDKDPRAIYFDQMEEFLYANMALITKLLNIKL